MKTTKSIGDGGEDQACKYLKTHGYEILERNWRTRWCEIDIIAKKDERIYFVEVKTRKSSVYGDGFAYITPKKLQQMSFAAEMWVSQNDWHGEYQLAAVSVTNEVIEFITEL